MPPLNRRQQRFLLMAIVVPIMAVVSASCGRDRGGERTATVVDSAGVEIVTSDDPAWSEADDWNIDPNPIFDIGADESDLAFNGIVGIDVMSNGRIIVGDRGGNNLTVLSAEGELLASIGGAGEGPGEFTSLAQLWVSAGDTITALNVPNNRLTKFNVEGAVLETTLVPHTPTAVKHVLGVAPGRGYWVAETRRSERSAPSPEPFRETDALVLVDAAGVVVDTITEFLGVESYVALIDRQGRSLTAVRNVLFGRKPVIRVKYDRLYVADTDRYEIQVWDTQGRLIRLIRKRHTARHVTAEHVARANDERREALEENRFIPEAIRRAEMEEIDNTPHRSTFPAFQSFDVDSEGNLWVRPYDIDPSNPPTYDVFSASGIYLGSVSLPVALTQADFGSDHILGVWRDELDVEHVRRYRIRKSN